MVGDDAPLCRIHSCGPPTPIVDAPSVVPALAGVAPTPGDAVGDAVAVASRSPSISETAALSISIAATREAL